jgi:hypothetical protein
MAGKYYLMAKDIGNGPYLMGELIQIGIGKYQFSYMIGADSFPEWYMVIPGMNDLGRTYGTDEVKEHILGCLIPESGSWGADIMMKQFGVAEYDEWALLESLIAQHERLGSDGIPLCDSHQMFYFYPEMPANAKKHVVNKASEHTNGRDANGLA